MKKKIGIYLDELLLYSGQYALFYILMNFSKEGLNLFSYTAHTVLVLSLIVQVFILVRYGDRFVVRILGSLICPLIYTLFEVSEISFFIMNMGHFFFWVFSLLMGILNAFMLKSNKRLRSILEFVTVFMNVVIFIFIYMYFDLTLKASEISGMIDLEYNKRLSILNLKNNITMFFEDSAHIYIALGGALLGVSLGIGRMKITYLKEKINDLFGKYMDVSVRDQLIENNGVYEEKRDLCIVFSDIRNFTQLSEANESAHIIEALNSYFSMWDEKASTYNGVINKFIGDAVMVIFGLQNNDNPESDAVNCSMEVLNSLKSLNEQMKLKGLPQFEAIGIGIHSGEMILGNLGSENRKEFTVIGDVVNTSSRLESLTKQLNTSMIVSETIYKKLDNGIKNKFLLLDPVTLKGKSNLVQVYRFN